MAPARPLASNRLTARVRAVRARQSLAPLGAKRFLTLVQTGARREARVVFFCFASTDNGGKTPGYFNDVSTGGITFFRAVPNFVVQFGLSAT